MRLSDDERGVERLAGEGWINGNGVVLQEVYAVRLGANLVG